MIEGDITINITKYIGYIYIDIKYYGIYDIFDIF